MKLKEYDKLFEINRRSDFLKLFAETFFLPPLLKAFDEKKAIAISKHYGTISTMRMLDMFIPQYNYLEYLKKNNPLAFERIDNKEYAIIEEWPGTLFTAVDPKYLSEFGFPTKLGDEGVYSSVKLPYSIGNYNYEYSYKYCVKTNAWASLNLGFFATVIMPIIPKFQKMTNPSKAIEYFFKKLTEKYCEFNNINTKENLIDFDKHPEQIPEVFREKIVANLQ